MLERGRGAGGGPAAGWQRTQPMQRTWAIFFDHGSYVNAPRNLFLAFELFMYINTVTQVLPPGGFCPNRECLGPVL